MKIDFEVYGEKAMFTVPHSRGGGFFYSYPVPTQEAIKGLAKHVYWKPSLLLTVERVRVMNEIQLASEGKKRQRVDTVPLLVNYTFLKRPRYQVTVRFEMNPFLADNEQYASDFVMGVNKHYSIFSRVLNRCGNRMPIYFGISEYVALIKPCVFGEGKGFYDDVDSIEFGTMFFSYDYPSETGRSGRHFADYTMENGVLDYTKFNKIEDLI